MHTMTIPNLVDYEMSGSKWLHLVPSWLYGYAMHHYIRKATRKLKTYTDYKEAEALLASVCLCNGEYSHDGYLKKDVE